MSLCYVAFHWMASDFTQSQPLTVGTPNILTVFFEVKNITRVLEWG